MLRQVETGRGRLSRPPVDAQVRDRVVELGVVVRLAAEREVPSSGKGENVAAWPNMSLNPTVRHSCERSMTLRPSCARSLRPAPSTASSKMSRMSSAGRRRGVDPLVGRCGGSVAYGGWLQAVEQESATCSRCWASASEHDGPRRGGTRPGEEVGGLTSWALARGRGTRRDSRG